MKIVGGQTLRQAFPSIAEALAAAGGRPTRPARPGLVGRWEQDASGRLHCIWSAVPACAPAVLDLAVLDLAVADRAAHVQALGVLR